MGIRERITNALRSSSKTKNSVDGNAFLKYGSRAKGTLVPSWSEVKMSDEDMYKGYPYAVIQKRGNKVSRLARTNLKTGAKPEVVDMYQKKEAELVHPYLKVIQNSVAFTEKQFWKNISIYLDLAGIYYLGVARGKMTARKQGLPDILGDVQEFIMLNPYEIRRVRNKDNEIAGYIERKKDGRYREWPLHQIIEIKELNPFDNEKPWGMADAAKDAVYTIQQSGDYTRQTLNGNLDAPGIITTDVILDDEDFANFTERVRQHTKGEPIFGNGAGAIKWESMQVDLDRAALLDINEMNRTALFAVSGTSKTSLGIEQSGTTRETARVQSEQFISDTAEPRLEDIIDFLNLDYRRNYPNEFKKTGYDIEIISAVGKDYATETQATQMRSAQLALALQLMQSGYTKESAYQYAEGEIELADLELEKGLDKPQMGGEEPSDGNAPQTPPEAPQGGSGSGGGEDSGSGVTDDLNGLEPHSDLLQNGGNSGGNPAEACICHNEASIKTFVERVDGKDSEELEEAYSRFLAEVRGVQKETIEAVENKVSKNSFAEEDLISEKKKKSLIEKLKNAVKDYWWILFPLFANDLTNKRNKEFNENTVFRFTNEIQEAVIGNADEVAKGHMQTILNDILSATNKAYTNILEAAASKAIIDSYRRNPEKFKSYFKEEPTEDEAMEAIHNTDILEENKRIYERANELAKQGYKRTDLVKAIREEYTHLSQTRANTIARNETSRALGHSQYEADYQFLKTVNKLDSAYKQLVSITGSPCEYCQALIDKGPIPFTQNFLDKGATLTVNDEKGRVKTFTANYEAIKASTVHTNCMCRYVLVFKNEAGEFTNVYNAFVGESDNDKCGSNLGWVSIHSGYELAQNINDNQYNEQASNSSNGGGNPYHDPSNGRFTTGPSGLRGSGRNVRESSEELGLKESRMGDRGERYFEDSEGNEYVLDKEKASRGEFVFEKTGKNVKPTEEKLLSELKGLAKEKAHKSIHDGSENAYDAFYEPYQSAIKELLGDSYEKFASIAEVVAGNESKDYDKKVKELRTYLASKESNRVVELSRKLLPVGSEIYRANNSKDGVSWTTNKGVAAFYQEQSGSERLTHKLNKNDRYIATEFIEAFNQNRPWDEVWYAGDDKSRNKIEAGEKQFNGGGNPYHDPANGQFTTGPSGKTGEDDGGGATSLDSLREMSEDEQDEWIKNNVCEDWLTKEWFDDMEAKGLNSRSLFQRFTDRLGLNGKPTVLSNEEFDSQSANSEKWRRAVGDSDSLSADEITKQLKGGSRTYQGSGPLGDGTYFADSHEEVKSYADMMGSNNNISTSLSVAMVSPEAKILDLRGKIKAVFGADTPTTVGVYSIDHEIGKRAKRLFDDVLPHTDISRASGSAISMAAMLAGYDGVRLDADVIARSTKGKDYLNVFSRDKLIMREDYDK